MFKFFLVIFPTFSFFHKEHETKNYQTIVTALSNGSRVVAGHNYGDLSADHYMDAIEEAMEKSPEITLDYIRSLRLSMVSLTVSSILMRTAADSMRFSTSPMRRASR